MTAPLRIGRHFEGFSVALRNVLEGKLDKGLAPLRSLTPFNHSPPTRILTKTEKTVEIIEVVT